MVNDFSVIFNELVTSFSRFPGVGKRSAERIVFSLLKMSQEELKAFALKIEDIHRYLKPCKLCNNFSAQDTCAYCNDVKRAQDVICIVEEPKDILAIEKTSQYRGLYYVLLGAISPLEGIGGHDLKIKKLLMRLGAGTITEIVIATDPDNEGELTAQFLIEKLAPYNLKIYRIAIGVPLGTQIEYIDSATLGKALIERRTVV